MSDLILEDILQTTIVLFGIALFAAAAYGDITALRIPNKLAIAVALLGVVRLIVTGDLNLTLYTVGTSVIVFIVTFVLFWRGILGGGDGKLLSATVLLIGYRDLFSFLLIMSICGALVSFVVLFIHRCLPLWLGPRLAVSVPRARLAVPYGVAIASAGVVTLLLQPSFIR
jgi:prepilin peptidase CpaA